MLQAGRSVETRVSVMQAEPHSNLHMQPGGCAFMATHHHTVQCRLKGWQ